MAGIKYIGPVFDGSGYAEAARNYVLSLCKKGYPVTVEPISFEPARPELGEGGRILSSLVKKDIPYDKILIHCTPDLWERLLEAENNKYIIGYTVWETSKIDLRWTQACNKVDEVWIPCEWNMQVFRDSGVTVPLYKIPHAIDVPNLDVLQNFNIEEAPQDMYVFYSIFQWQERKNPYGLLTAYNAAFTGIEDVLLILKTYNRDQAENVEEVKRLVLEFRKYISLDHYPKILLIVENMSRENVLALHNRGDCFVLLQRSEGWGLPHFEAAACGKPVITSRYGGQTEFLSDENSYLVDYTLCPVTGMPWSPYYRGDQLWCEPNLEHAVKLMRHVYNNKDEAAEKGRKARRYVEENFTWDKVGSMLVDRLRQIDRRIAPRVG
jgi:glycosyltransferase involved in cell wall biosynthesis